MITREPKNEGPLVDKPVEQHENAVCGDGHKTGNEQCDDGNTKDGDGCSSTCQEELGWSCTKEADKKSVCHTICGDGHAAGKELCDDGNTDDGDGCSHDCKIESGYECALIAGAKSVCSSSGHCGNAVLEPEKGESCDDGNTLDGDGCSGNCQIEDGYTCVSPVPKSYTLPSEETGEYIYVPVTYIAFLDKDDFEQSNHNCPKPDTGGKKTSLVEEKLGSNGFPWIKKENCENSYFKDWFDPNNGRVQLRVRRFVRFNKKSGDSVYKMVTNNFKGIFSGMVPKGKTLESTNLIDDSKKPLNYVTAQLHYYASPVSSALENQELTFSSYFDLFVFVDGLLQGKNVGWSSLARSFNVPMSQLKADPKTHNLVKVDTFYTYRLGSAQYKDDVNIEIPYTIASTSTCFKCGDGVVDAGEGFPQSEQCDVGPSAKEDDVKACLNQCKKISSGIHCLVDWKGTTSDCAVSVSQGFRLNIHPQ